MLSTTVGQLLINEALPKDLRDYSRKLDAKGTAALLQQIAEQHPDKYREISKALADIGHRASYETGGYSFGVRHLATPERVRKFKATLNEQISRILTNRRLKDDEKEKLVVSTIQDKTKELETITMEEALKAENPLAYQIISGAKGSPGNLRSVLGGDLLYEDQAEKAIPVPVMRSYAQGLSPAEYWAGTYGTRRGVHLLKAATQDAGFLGKQLVQLSHRLLVTEHDGKFDGNLRGMPVSTDDADSSGSLLAADVGGYKRNSVITPKLLATLKAKGVDRILVRSPITGGPSQGGLYATDVGVRERGGLPPIGDNVGIPASQATAEQVSQAQISAKHTGGVAGAGGGQSGFKYLDQAFQVPKTFTGGATHADIDGKVGAIFPAPAGGHYMMIGGHRHYIRVGADPTVKPGAIVEAGDVVSTGLPNPATIVEHKGIGEGRRYFVDILRDLHKASGWKHNRRNLELLSRGAINHVRLVEQMGDYLPDDVVQYDAQEHSYKPRRGYQVVSPKSATGLYLERPILHYSIGTKIRPSVIKELEHWKVKNVVAHTDPPPFQPEMIRAMYNLSYDPDWMTRHLGSGLEKSTLSSAHRGAASDELGTSFVPSLARAVDFGRVGLTKTWNPKDVVKIKPA